MSIKAKIYNQKAEKVGDIDLPSNIFGLEANNSLIHQAMLAQMGNERQVLAHTKDRSEVRGGGKKPWRQKGTGRARAGSSRSPIWIGGGVTFGPTKDRNFSKDINKKMRRKATMMVLSDRALDGLIVLDEIKVKESKTKEMDAIVKTIEEKIIKTEKSKKRSILILDNTGSDDIKVSSKNLQGIKFINTENINIVDLLKYSNLVMTKKAVENLIAKYK